MKARALLSFESKFLYLDFNLEFYFETATLNYGKDIGMFFERTLDFFVNFFDFQKNSNVLSTLFSHVL